MTYATIVAIHEQQLVINKVMLQWIKSQFQNHQQFKDIVGTLHILVNNSSSQVCNDSVVISGFETLKC